MSNKLLTYSDMKPGMMLVELSYFDYNVIKYRYKLCLGTLPEGKQAWPGDTRILRRFMWYEIQSTFEKTCFKASYNFTYEESRSEGCEFFGNYFLFNQNGNMVQCLTW